MKKKVMLMCVLLLVVGSCTAIRQGGISYTEEEIKNYKAMVIMAKNLISVTEFQIGMFEAGLGDDINKLPASAVSAIAELKLLTEIDPNDLTDYQLGASLGLRIRILSAIVREALEIYAPDLLLFLL